MGARLGLFADRAAGLRHVALATTAPAQAALVARLDRLGIAYRPERHRDSDSIYFADPDGTTLEVMVPRTLRPMVRFVFSVEDLARTRFAISPMLELVHSLVALRDPAHAALHVPWLRSLSGRLDGLPLERRDRAAPAARLHPRLPDPPAGRAAGQHRGRPRRAAAPRAPRRSATR